MKMRLPAPKQRHYWHADLKWISGIVLACSLGISLALLALGNVTAKNVAVPVATQAVASIYSPAGLDDAQGFAQLRKLAIAQPGNTVQPIPGLPATITDQQLRDMSPREVRLHIFQQVVASHYEQGLSADAREQFRSKAGLLGLLTKQTHQNVQGWFWLSLLPLILSLAAAVYFSRRLGRLVTPGVVALLVAGWPAVVLVSGALAPPTARGALPPETLQQLASAAYPPYLVTALIGGGLLLTASGFKLSHRFRLQGASSPQA